ncbi:MAG: aldolase/citrate lyase family protein [Gammaproteobacteria bacterium]
MQVPKVPTNHFKSALRRGELQLGLWSNLSSHVSVELLANAGFDWLLIDTEHSPNELPMVHCQLQAIGRGATHPIVRPTWNDTVTIKRYLDIGVQTLLVPFVQDAEEARQAVASTRYPPRGVRGYAAAARASDFGRIKDYPTACEDQLCVLLQVETPAALAQIEAIAQIEGVDGIFIGPGDLAAAMGFIGQVGHAEVVAAIDDAIARIRAAGKPAGVLAGEERLARRWIEVGATFVAVGSDTGLLARGAEQLAAKFRTANSAA